MYVTPAKQAQMTQEEVEQVLALQAQKRLTSYPYYSRVRIRATRSAGAGSSYLYTVASGAEFRAFSYAVGDSKSSAGYLDAEGNATAADTNLAKGSETTAGQAVLVRGLAIQTEPAALERTDNSNPFNVRLQSAALLAAIAEAVEVKMSLNGSENQFRLGPIGNIPGGSGLSGAAENKSGIPNLQGPPPAVPFATNGWATRANHYMLPEGLLWKPQGNPDSDLNVVFRTTRAITVQSGDPDNPLPDVTASNAPDTVASGVAAWNYPAVLVQDLRVLIIGEVVAKRTNAA